MRDVSAVISGQSAYFGLKHHALLFDHFHVGSLSFFIDPANSYAKERRRADLEFLASRGFIEELDSSLIDEGMELPESASIRDVYLADKPLVQMTPKDEAEANASIAAMFRQQDALSRAGAIALSKQTGVEVLPICSSMPADKSSVDKEHLPGQESRTALFSLILNTFPVPSEDCSWEAILDFHGNTADLRWSFRRWLKEFAGKPRSAGEIRDELEWNVRQFELAMQSAKAKASQGVLEAIITTPLEAVEDLAKLRLSKLIKPFFAAERRQADLAEARLKAPGKECAYVYHARRFVRDGRAALD